LRKVLARKDRKRFETLDRRARRHTFVLEVGPEAWPDEESLEWLLKGGARLCPWCRWGFVKEGGCDYMTCE
jgi:hypothetical protein